MITALREGAIIGAEISPEDVRRADSIFGKPYPYLAGKTTWRDPDLPAVIKGENIPLPKLQGHTDIMQVAGVIALVTVFKPIDLTLMNLMPSKGHEAKKTAFLEQIGILKGAGFEIEQISGDAGDGYGTILNEIMGPTFIPRSPGRHDGIVEAKIRRLKETLRCLLHSLPFGFNISLIRYAMKCVTYYSNLFPTRSGYKGLSPREALTGVKVDVKTCAGIGFG